MHLGHPFSNLYKEDYQEVVNKYNLNKAKHFISLLPGSRKSEVKYMLPTFIEFIKDHSMNNKDYFYLLPVADNELLPLINQSFQDLDLPILIRKNAMKDFLSVSELSIATSGTATLESAILECPPVICYKTNFLNYSIISRMLKIENIGLPNLLLSKRYYKELLQKDFNKENILKSVTETKSLISESLENANKLRNMLKGNGYYEATKSISSL
jgi:lipid-A-disaccharide synthase